MKATHYNWSWRFVNLIAMMLYMTVLKKKKRKKKKTVVLSKYLVLSFSWALKKSNPDSVQMHVVQVHVKATIILRGIKSGKCSLRMDCGWQVHFSILKVYNHLLISSDCNLPVTVDGSSDPSFIQIYDYLHKLELHTWLFFVMSWK